MHSPMPFVVGCPRSGTTLLRLMLDAHPDIAIPAETHFYAKMVFIEPDSPQRVEEALATLVESSVWPNFGIDTESFVRSVREGGAVDVSDVLRAFYRTYAARLGKDRSGDKFPGNLLHMTRIARLLPEARFVHIIRDGRDVAVSLRETWFRPADSFEGCIALWTGRIASAREQAATGIPYLEVRYEALVTDPVPVLREICRFVGVAYDPSMLRYFERAGDRLAEMRVAVVDGKPLDGRSIATLMNTNREPFADSIGRWRSAMMPGDADACHHVARATLVELGYDVP